MHIDLVYSLNLPLPLQAALGSDHIAKLYKFAFSFRNCPQVLGIFILKPILPTLKNAALLTIPLLPPSLDRR
jgi:hypothetical protein